MSNAATPQEVLQIACSLHESFNVIHTATALHKTAKLMALASRQAVLRHPGIGLLRSLAEAQAASFKGQATGNALWALARMQQQPSGHLLSSLTTAVHRNLPAFKGQELANSIWGLATVGHTPDQELLGAIAKQATTFLRDANAVWFVDDVLLAAA